MGISRDLTAAMGCLLVIGSAMAQEGLLASGDAAWDARATGHSGARALPGRIGEAIDAYSAALEADPRNREARWKLMRALFFLGEHVLTDRAERLVVFTRGRDLGEAGLAMMAGGEDPDSLREMEAPELRELLGEQPHAARMFFWSAVHWGLWGRTRGRIASAREGVAGKIRDYAEATVALDEIIENGGGHRILGRLHAEAPKIPFITGWIDRDLSVEELTRCLEIAPDDLLTRLYFAEALIDYQPRRRAEGIEMLRDLVTREPNPEWLVEEIQAIELAEQRLEGETD